MSTSEELFRNMQQFVRDETVAQRDSFQKLWQTPLHERVREGRCLDGLNYAGTVDNKIKFECQRQNDSDFREDDLVRVSLGEPNFSVLEANVYRVEDHAIWLTGKPNSLIDKPEGPWVLDHSHLDLSETFFRALDELASSARGRERILPVLTGEAKNTTELQLFSESLDAMPDGKTNDSQKEAIAQGVAAELVHLIQGPPGTGKTYVLAEIVRQRIEAGECILVTGPTHRAIHHALNQIRKILPENVPVVKIGRVIHDPDLQVAQYENFADSPLADAQEGYVVGATPFAARSRLGKVDFDTVLIDEASQITLPLAVMAMLSAETYLFIGDHQQLPPVVLSVPPLEAATVSIFHHLAGRGNTSLLTHTYRMNDTLTHWPSESFYSGKLRAAPANASRRLALPGRLQDFHEVLDPAHPLVLVEMEHATSYRHSDDEASLVANLLLQLHLAGIALENVAVVAPFRRQARRIRSFLGAKKELRRPDWADCAIDTVERMQGQEREVILISMTASDPVYLQKMAEFLLLPQRLNVALTRARSKVILIASRQISRIPALAETFDLVDFWKTLRQHAHTVAL